MTDVFMKDKHYSSQSVLTCISLSNGLLLPIKRLVSNSLMTVLFILSFLNGSIAQSPGSSNPLLDIHPLHIQDESDACKDVDKDGICDADDICPNDPLDACHLPVPCIPDGGNNSFEFIQQIIFNTINNTSGNNGGYGDFTNLFTSVNNGKTYDIHLTPGFTGAAYHEAWRVWIDFNKDGDFDDDNETVIEANSNTPISTKLTIPADVTTNGTTRMRISMQYNTAATPCQTVSFGEVEDYFVRITKACAIGQSCDDEDQCTVNDILDAECNCVGTQVDDTDNDGICDAIDECPGIDDGLIGQSCDDGDSCTENDIYGIDCGCAGEYIDRDGDGICIGEDPDDNDACNPNVKDCSPCEEKSKDNFDRDYGSWIDGGGDCSRIQLDTNHDGWWVRLRDNSGAESSMTTNDLYLASYNEVAIDFSFIAHSMETGEDFFLEISTNGGNRYSQIRKWVSGIDFYNDTPYNESITIDNYNLTNHTRLRLRCDASSNGDQVYIDDVTIKVCSHEDLLPNDEANNTDELALFSLKNRTEVSLEEIKEGVQIYPNPALYYLNVKIDKDIKSLENISIHISDMTGKIIKQYSSHELKSMDYRIDLSTFQDGLVMMSTVLDNRVLKTQKIIILKK